MVVLKRCKYFLSGHWPQWAHHCEQTVTFLCLISKVNILARKSRHQKLFQESGSLLHFIPTFLTAIQRLKSAPLARFDQNNAATNLPVNTQLDILRVFDVPRSLFKRACYLTVIFFVMSTVNVAFFDDNYSFAEMESTLDLSVPLATTYGDQGFVVTDGSYLVKSVPSATDMSKYYNRGGMVKHEVQPGEYLALIAAKYGLKVNTLMWANGISDSTVLHPGEQIIVPQADGVVVSVKKGDTVEKYAKAYRIDSTLIASANHLDGDLLIEGDKILLPNVRPLPAPKPRYQEVSRASTSSRVASSTTTARVEKADVEVLGNVTSLLFPTSGQVTQGFHTGHYAIDIGDRSMPAVVAAADGVISEVSEGGWGGGYGTNIVVNHGDGLQTRYAHLNKAYVSAGQSVSAGEAIGQMGNTGRVYGQTGIHLHFEVIKDGVKINPWKMIK